MRGDTPLDSLLFLTIVYSPSIVRWTIAAICLPRLIHKITTLRITAFFAINIVTQVLIAFFQTAREINVATLRVAIAESFVCLVWMGLAAARRRRR